MGRQSSISAKAILKRKNEISLKIKELQAEYADLEVAQRVLSRMSFAGESASEIQNTPQNSVSSSVASAMTVADMAINLLRLNDINAMLGIDEEGMESSEILDGIRKKWKPDLARTSLSPPLSRLKKDGIIELHGKRWKLVVKKNEAPIEKISSDASETDDDGADLPF